LLQVVLQTHQTYWDTSRGWKACIQSKYPNIQYSMSPAEYH
jgi:hypothetical protein